MKSILIPTDFSDNAGDALAYTLGLVGHQPVRVHILHVVEPNVTSPGLSVVTTDLITAQLDDARTNMQALEGFSQTTLADQGKTNVKVTTNVAVGTTSATLQAEAKEIHADAIIMGTQGSNHSTVEKVLGTVSTNVIREAPCPVILVPRGYVFKVIDTALFATSLDHSDPYELWRATELIKPHLSVVRCLHVVKDRVSKNDAALEAFAKYMVEHSPAIQTIFHIELGQNIEATIAEYAKDYDAELIIMHRAKRNLWETIFGPSHTKRMVFKLKVPLLVLN